MPSRIDIGPEGGPFVAINENSNDLELQDINGNVIAVWDETEGQWDLNNNSLTNINAIDASSATLGEGYLTNAEQPLNSGIVEDFRSESFAHYDLASETGDMDFVTSPRINSDTPTLQHNPTTAASSGLASSLPYGGRGYVYSLITRFDATTGPETSLYAATTDTSNRIRFKFEARNNTAKIILLDGGTATSLASEGSLTVNANEWYTMLVTLGSEYIEYDIKNQSGGSILSSPLTTTDNTQDGVGFGIELRNDGGESGYVAQLARRPL